MVLLIYYSLIIIIMQCKTITSTTEWYTNTITHNSHTLCSNTKSCNLQIQRSRGCTA